MPPAPPLIVPEMVFASVKLKVSLAVPPVKLAKLEKVNVAVLSFNVPLLLPVMLHVFTVFSPIKVFVPLPPATVLKLVKVKVAVASFAVPA